MITAIQATSVVKTFASQYADAGFSNFTLDPLANTEDTLLRLYNSLSPKIIVSLVESLQPFQFIEFYDDSIYVFAPLGLFKDVILELRAHGPVIWYQFKHTKREPLTQAQETYSIEPGSTTTIPIQFGFLDTVLALPSSIKLCNSSEISRQYISKSLHSKSSCYRQDIQNIVESVLDLDEFKVFMSGMMTSPITALEGVALRLQKAGMVILYLSYIIQNWSTILGNPVVPSGVKYKGNVSDLMYILLIYCMYEDSVFTENLLSLMKGKNSLS